MHMYMKVFCNEIKLTSLAVKISSFEYHLFLYRILRSRKPLKTHQIDLEVCIQNEIQRKDGTQWGKRGQSWQLNTVISVDICSKL